MNRLSPSIFHLPLTTQMRFLAALRRLRALTSVVVVALTIAGCSAKQPEAHVSMLHPDLVLVARVGSEEVQPQPAGCALQTFERMPAGVVRDLGSIDLAGTVPPGTDIFVSVNQKACESGADAIVVSQREQRNLADRTEYHIVAEAILLHTNEDTAPAAVAQPPSTEALMQPISGDENSDQLRNVSRSAMTESSIAATEAAPLKPSRVPRPEASPLPQSSPTTSGAAEATPASTASAASPSTTSAPPAETATATPIATATNTATPTLTATAAATESPQMTVTLTATASATPTATITETPTVTATETPSPEITASPTATATATSTATITETPTLTPTVTSTATPTVAATLTATATPSDTPTLTATATTEQPSMPPSATSSPTPAQPTASATSSPSGSPVSSPDGGISPGAPGD